MSGIITEAQLALPQNEQRAEDPAHNQDEAGNGEQFDDPVEWRAGNGQHQDPEKDQRSAPIPLLPPGPKLRGLRHGQ